MTRRDEDQFRVKTSASKSRGGPRTQRFVSQVLKQVSKSGAKPVGKGIDRPANTFGRGRVAAAVAGRRLAANARRVVIKSRFVVLRRASPNSAAIHLHYIERDGVTRDGQKGQAYDAETNAADVEAFQERGQTDRHQFRFIVSAEDGLELEDLKGFTRQLMRRMETDLETRLDWVAVDHWDTDNPHTHIVLNGHTGGPARSKEDLVIAPDYMAHGMRLRASEVATEWLGPRTEAEIRQSLQREVDQARLTSLDNALIRQAGDDGIDLKRNPVNRYQQNALRARLQRLENMGLAEKMDANRWKLHPDMAATLDAMGQREDALRLLRQALKGQQRESLVHERLTSPVIGRIAGKGLADELHDRGYLVVDGIDGRAHYLTLPANTDLSQLPVGGIVDVKLPAQGKATDHNILAFTSDGIYSSAIHKVHLARAGDLEPQASVDVHVRRLEALRRSGVVERVGAGIWAVPTDFLQRAHRHDAKKVEGNIVELRSRIPIEQQIKTVGVTWLDLNLATSKRGRDQTAANGFGGHLRDALVQRSDFLVEQGLAQRKGQRVILAQDLLKTLRGRELAAVGVAVQHKTGKAYRPAKDGEQIRGIYRSSVELASDRYAVLDDGKSFSLVPWRSVIEHRVGQEMSAVVNGRTATWQIGRSHGVAI